MHKRKLIPEELKGQEAEDEKSSRQGGTREGWVKDGMRPHVSRRLEYTKQHIQPGYVKRFIWWFSYFKGSWERFDSDEETVFKDWLICSFFPFLALLPLMGTSFRHASANNNSYWNLLSFEQSGLYQGLILWVTVGLPEKYAYIACITWNLWSVGQRLTQK